MADDFALRMMKKLGWEEGKGLGKEEDGRVRPVQVEQKQNVKGIGFGTEGAFAPWWDDLYNKTAVGSKIEKSQRSKEEKVKRKEKSDAKLKREKKRKEKEESKMKRDKIKPKKNNKQ